MSSEPAVTRGAPRPAGPEPGPPVDLRRPPSAPPRPRALVSRRRALVSILVGLAIWEAVARFVVANTAFLAAPSAVAVALWRMLLDGQILYHCAISGQEFLWGYLLGSAAGVLVGTLMATSQAVHDYLDPWISAMYAAPIIALAPLVIL
jgi:NitT/TauT family transport system permease protein